MEHSIPRRSRISLFVLLVAVAVLPMVAAPASAAETSPPDWIFPIVGADGVDFAAAASKALALYDQLGYSELPVCMAKTHLSISHDPKLLGRPTGFRVPIRDVKLAAGAGFIYPLAGDMRTMPGLPSQPAGNNVDIDEYGKPVGLF